MIGRATTENTGTITAINTAVTMTTMNTMAEMITGAIVDIGRSLFIIITITMSTSTATDMTVIGIRGNHGSTTKAETPTMPDMVIMKDTITNWFSCSMMA